MGNDEAYDPWVVKHSNPPAAAVEQKTLVNPTIVHEGTKFGWESKKDVSEFVDVWSGDGSQVVWKDYKIPEYIPLDSDHVFVNEAICGGPNHPSNTKPSNPKDSVGIAKVPFSTVSAVVWAEVGLAMMEGARKYGRHNYREVGVLASVYYDATLRHLTDWYEGQDIDPGSGLSHITKAIASLTVLRDSMIRENWVDDRPPAIKDGWMDELNAKAKEIIERYPNAVPAFTNKKVT